MTRFRLSLLSGGLSLALVAIAPASSAYYGDITMTRTAIRFGVPPVVFPHWAHRVQYTCDACHPAIFRMQAGSHEIMMERMAARKEHCLACHDGTTAWAPVDCARCHVSQHARRTDPAIDRLPAPGAPFAPRNADATRLLAGFPRDARHTIDWNEAVRRGLIAPRRPDQGAKSPGPLPGDTAMSRTSPLPPATFSHAAHATWLDCQNCHPSPFAPSNTTNTVSMEAIWSGRYCGACHGRVAFPLIQCDRCHAARTPSEASRLATEIRRVLDGATGACAVSTLDGKPIAAIDPATGQRSSTPAAAPATGGRVHLWSLALSCP